MDSQALPPRVVDKLTRQEVYKVANDYVTLDSFLKGAGVSRRPHEPPALRSGGGTAHS